jgi:SPP1 gp7 family putative phage head morphogenesis protein
MSQLSETIISHQIWLQRLGTQTASLSIPFVNKMRAEVRDAVLKFGDDARTVKKLNKMLASLDGVLSDVTGDWKNTIEKSLRDIADYENKWFIHTLQDNTKAKTFITAPTAEDLWARIKFAPLALSNAPLVLNDLLSGWGDNERNRLLRGVQTGFVQGQTTRQIVSGVAGAGGLADISERNVMTVVRTAVSHVSNTARDEVYSSNNDIVQKYQWVSTLDSRTSTVCKSRDGQKYVIGKGPMPPAHPNCRSTTIPVIEDDFLDFLDEGAVRAARGANGGTQVDASTSYYDFLKQQPAWFQDEALGPVRGKIFRNSGISPEEFRVISVDGFGRPLTLQQMADLDKRVADYLKGL